MVLDYNEQLALVPFFFHDDLGVIRSKINFFSGDNVCLVVASGGGGGGGGGGGHVPLLPPPLPLGSGTVNSLIVIYRPINNFIWK